MNSTSGLDPKNARIIKDIILEFQQSGGTVFLTTHLMHDADELCDRVAFIADGEIREIDSPRNLKLRYGRREVSVEYRDQEYGLQKEAFDMDTLAENARFFQILRTKELITIHSGETTLDDIFIKVTGVSSVSKINQVPGQTRKQHHHRLAVMYTGEINRMKVWNQGAAFFVAIWIMITSSLMYQIKLIFSELRFMMQLQVTRLPA